MESYALIIIPITAGLLAQVIKFAMFSFKHGLNWQFLLEYGHMPSSHTAVMSGLIYAIGYYQGTGTPEFATAFIVTLLIISDAMHLRMYVGSYGKTLNNLIDRLKIEEDHSILKLKERVGHRPSEIAGGALLGILTALVLIRVFEIVA